MCKKHTSVISINVKNKIAIEKAVSVLFLKESLNDLIDIVQRKECDAIQEEISRITTNETISTRLNNNPFPRLSHTTLKFVDRTGSRSLHDQYTFSISQGEITKSFSRPDTSK
jgi:23S rRNA A1618 N6-methylase RlmF